MLRKEYVGHPALTDAHTGLANRLHFELVYSYLFHAGDRGVALTVMLLELGGFDGSAELLRRAGQRLQKVTRGSDLVTHLEEGRFLVLLLASNLQGGLLAADRVQSALQEESNGPVSVGLASYAAEMKEPVELLTAAEEALGLAKKAGGGIEVVHT